MFPGPDAHPVPRGVVVVVVLLGEGDGLRRGSGPPVAPPLPTHHLLLALLHLLLGIMPLAFWKGWGGC